MTAVCAVVNGGNLMRPYIVQQIISLDGTVIQKTEPTVKQKVISEQTSATMRELMEYTVQEGNGKNVSIAGYRVGGKSGTSQKLDSADEKARIASFVGVAPIENPQIAVLVCLDEPHSWTTAGGSLSAPVVANVLEETLEYYGAERHYTPEEQQRLETVVPEVCGWNPEAAGQALRESGLSVKLMGNGKEVVKQFPVKGTTLPRGSTVLLYTENVEPAQTAVPAIAGMSLYDATNELHRAGLNLRALGAAGRSGTVVVNTDYATGAVLPMGSVVEAKFYELIHGDD